MYSPEPSTSLSQLIFDGYLCYNPSHPWANHDNMHIFNMLNTNQYRWFTFDTSPSAQVYSSESVAVHCTWVNSRRASRGKNIQTEESVDTGLTSLPDPGGESGGDVSRKDTGTQGRVGSIRPSLHRETRGEESEEEGIRKWEQGHKWKKGEWVKTA